MKVLWFASWYPTAIHPFDGDFIQRHAEAVSLYHDVQVFKVVRDKEGSITNDVVIKENERGRLRESIIYYYSRPIAVQFIDRIFSQLKYTRLYRKAIKEYLHTQGRPDLVHVHTGMKAGLLASWLMRRKGIPYVVTEHWAGFLPEADKRFEDLPAYFRYGWTRTIQQSKGVQAVSTYLANDLKRLFGKQLPVTVIANVVNTQVFYPGEARDTITMCFIHVSGAAFQKNSMAVIEAFSILNRDGVIARLKVFGSTQELLKEKANVYGLADSITFYGEVPQPVLAAHMREANALILYSRYETFGCVVIEANACGLPVIASDIPIMHELIKEGENGMFVKSEDPGELATALRSFSESPTTFDAARIAKDAGSKYGYESIGKIIGDWYKL